MVLQEERTLGRQIHKILTWGLKCHRSPGGSASFTLWEAEKASQTGGCLELGIEG